MPAAALTFFGAPSPRTLQFLRACAAATGNPDGFLRHALTALSVAVQRGNAGILNAAVAKWWQFGVR